MANNWNNVRDEAIVKLKSEGYSLTKQYTATGSAWTNVSNPGGYNDRTPQLQINASDLGCSKILGIVSQPSSVIANPGLASDGSYYSFYLCCGNNDSPIMLSYTIVFICEL